MQSAVKAKVFRNGRSQAVRIPAEYRFRTEEVYIQRDARTGALTLSEHQPEMSLKELFAELDAAGAADLEIERDLRPDVERDWM